MGDRANIYLVDVENKPGIYYYSHWGGKEWGTVELANALAFGRGRWSDPFYLNRILASRLYADIVDMETGGGIGTVADTGEHPLTVVDHPSGLVWQMHEGLETNHASYQAAALVDGVPFAQWVERYATVKT